MVVGRVVAGVQEGCSFVEELFYTERKENCILCIPEQQQILADVILSVQVHPE